MGKKKNIGNAFLTVLFVILSIGWIAPILVVLNNSLKKQIYIPRAPFELVNEKTFAGLKNYISGIEKTGFFSAFGRSLIITVGSVGCIVVLTAMTAWMITRYKSKTSSMLYYAFVFSMIVPFQMVMFTMSKVANTLHLNTTITIIPIYVGFGAGLAVFIYSGFIRSIPIDMEEAAMIDGANPLQSFFRVIFPILTPTAVTVAILNTMWVWNDYLLPSLILDHKQRTIPMAVQFLRGNYGSVDLGALMAMMILAIIPIIIFYSLCQKYIIEGVLSGAVKG